MSVSFQKAVPQLRCRVAQFWITLCKTFASICSCPTFERMNIPLKILALLGFVNKRMNSKEQGPNVHLTWTVQTQKCHNIVFRGAALRLSNNAAWKCLHNSQTKKWMRMLFWKFRSSSHIFDFSGREISWKENLCGLTRKGRALESHWHEQGWKMDR